MSWYVFFTIFACILPQNPIFSRIFMVEKTSGIVLRSIKYGDNSLIVDMLTDEGTRRSFIARVSNSKRAKMRPYLFQPLSILEVEYDSRVKGGLYRIQGATVNVPYSSIPFDASKLALALFLAEFLYHATRDEQENEPLYLYLEQSLRWLDGVEEPCPNFHLVLMMRLTRFVGFFPNTEGYRVGAYFDLLDGTYRTSPPMHPHVLPSDEAAKINTLMRLNFETMHLFKMTRAERARCLEVILQYYRLHVPGFPELKSLDVLKETFS